MSHHSKSSSPAMSLRRSSATSERTLVDTSSRKVHASEKEYQDFDPKSSLDTYSTKSRASSSSFPSMMDKAAKKVKSKLGSKDSTSKPKPKPKPRQQVPDSYPDMAFMWQALAESKM
ncbi:hypothetical protein F4804DRAFT_317664 [Jackrogersella minutella]|nr:hypothetical protein F4804DRAFT_317664 [Jackrogersella minutella]